MSPVARAASDLFLAGRRPGGSDLPNEVWSLALEECDVSSLWAVSKTNKRIRSLSLTEIRMRLRRLQESLETLTPYLSTVPATMGAFPMGARNPGASRRTQGLALGGDMETICDMLCQVKEAVLLRPVGRRLQSPFTFMCEELERRHDAAIRSCEAISHIGLLDEIGDLVELVRGGHCLEHLRSRSAAAWLDFQILHPAPSMLATFLEDVMNQQTVPLSRLGTLRVIMPAMTNVHVTGLAEAAAELDDRTACGSFHSLVFYTLVPSLEDCSERLRIWTHRA